VYPTDSTLQGVARIEWQAMCARGMRVGTHSSARGGRPSLCFWLQQLWPTWTGLQSLRLPCPCCESRQVVASALGPLPNRSNINTSTASCLTMTQCTHANTGPTSCASLVTDKKIQGTIDSRALPSSVVPQQVCVYVCMSCESD